MRSVLITGGSRGIGAAAARRCAQAGWDVWVGYAQDEASAARVVLDVEALGRRAQALRVDVGDEASVRAAFERARHPTSGLAPLGAVVNSAGVVAPLSRLDEMEVARWERILRTNVLGSLLVAREALRALSTRHGGPGGAVVLLSSAAARLGSPGEYVDYAASKGAVDTLTVGLAREVAREGVRVNAVRPGIIDTEIHALGGQPDRVARLGPAQPMGRAGTADEVAAAIVWLLSSEAAYTTGAVLDVSGGR